jgi:hypothetical protein
MRQPKPQGEWAIAAAMQPDPDRTLERWYQGSRQDAGELFDALRKAIEQRDEARALLRDLQRHVVG